MIEIKPIAFVTSSRKQIKDDYWGGQTSVITLVDELPDEAFEGIDAYSHLEIIFHFHQADPAKIITGKRHPRGNPDWPEVGIFARRGKNRPNHLGLSVVKLIKRDGRSLTVEGLDTIDGTPVIDIKPLMTGFLPREKTHQPKWADEIMKDYWKR